MYSPLARDGALIVFHDILEHPPKLGVEVERYWNEIRAGYRHVEIDLSSEAVGRHRSAVEVRERVNQCPLTGRPSSR